MSQVTEQSVRFQTAFASIKLIQASAVLDLTEDDFDFLTSNKVWIATDRSRARRCVEACVYGTLDFVGYPRFLLLLSLLLPSLLIMFIPSTFKRPVSSWKALNLRKTLLMASSVRLKPLNCSRLPCVYAQETLTFLLTQKRSEERFSRNAETDLVCRLLLEKKKLAPAPSGRRCASTRCPSPWSASPRRRASPLSARTTTTPCGSRR